MYREYISLINGFMIFFIKQNYQEFAVRSYLKPCKYLKGCSTWINAILAHNYAAPLK